MSIIMAVVTSRGDVGLTICSYQTLIYETGLRVLSHEICFQGVAVFCIWLVG